MRILLPCLTLLCIHISSKASDPAAIPVEHFAADPLFTHASLSPEGDSIAFLREFGNLSYLCFLDLESEEIRRLKLGSAPAYHTRVSREVGSYTWINNDRLLLTTMVWDRTYGSIAINKDGSRWKGLTGYENAPDSNLVVAALEVLSTAGDNGDEILMLDRRALDGRDRMFPHVIRLNTVSGTFQTLQENPGDIASWILDPNGDIRIGVKQGASNELIYRKDSDAPWTSITLPGRGREKLRVLGFGRDSQFYVRGFNEHDRWCLYPYDLELQQLGDAILSDALYDSVPEGRVPSYAGISLSSPISSAKDNRLLGMRWVSETPRVAWFDEHYAKIQLSVDRALPETVNLFIGSSEDESKLLFLSMSDVQPGIYHLLDQQARSLRPIGSRMPWLNPDQLSPMLAIHYETRDGLTVHGYLTLPQHLEPKALPTVILTHGGPWVRDVWSFDPLVQLLASRGYAVLQVNYRGSIGYGSEFRMAGTREIGGKIQDDIDDGTQWIVKTGIADPERLAILGHSYGGYSALFAVGTQPERYRCAISIAGVSDWHAMFRNDSTRPEYRRASAFWTKEIGDPTLDEQRIQEISPYFFADQIRVPVLFIHGKEDSTVPISQSKRMASKLRKAGTPVEESYFGWETHGLGKQRSREAAYTQILEFLTQYLNR